MSRTIQANGRTYKPEEFICEWCHTPLVLDTYYHIEGKNVCQSCRNKERCASCGFLITETKYVTVDHLTYHPDCFRCSECLIELHKFHLENGKLYCNECINLQASTNPEDLCGKCYLPLSGGIIKALGKRYHEDCFVCHSCFGPFPNDEFVNISGNPFCDNCIENRSYLTSTAHIKATGAAPPPSTTKTSTSSTTTTTSYSSGAPAGGYGTNPSGYGSSNDRGLPGSGSSSSGYGSNTGAPGAGGYGSNTGPGAGGYGSNTGPGAGGYGSNTGAPGAGGYGSNTGPGAGGYGSNTGAPGAGGYGSNTGAPGGYGSNTGAPGAGGYGSNTGPGAGGYGSNTGGPGYGSSGAPSYGAGAAPVPRELSAGGLEYGSVNNIPAAPPAGGPGYGSSGGPGYGAGGAPGGPGYGSNTGPGAGGPGYGSSSGPGATGGKKPLVDDDDDDDDLDTSNLPARSGSSKFDQKTKIKIGGGMKEEKRQRDYKSKAALGFAHESEHLKDLESLGYKTIRVKAPPK